MTNKRGISGIEVIISFTIFIGFVIFIFVYMNPLNMPASRTSLTSLENAVSDNATIEIEVTPFAVNTTLLAGKSCFQINNTFGENIFVTDKDDRKVSFGISGNNLLVNNTGKFYYINKGISGAQSTLTDCLPLSKGNGYSLSVPRTERFYYNKSLIALKNIYDTNYSKLKQNFKFPAVSDFSVIILNSSHSEIIAMTKPLPKMNILTKEFPIEILNDNGDITKGYIRLLAW